MIDISDIRGYSPSVCKENLEKETVFIIKTEISIKMSLFYIQTFVTVYKKYFVFSLIKVLDL